MGDITGGVGNQNNNIDMCQSKRDKRAVMTIW